MDGGGNNIYVTQHVIDWAAASEAACAAVKAAIELGIRINVAVVDRSGLLIAFLRMEGAPLHSSEIAIDKAYTAASFGLPTKEWTEALKMHSEGVQRGVILRSRFIAFGGGCPIFVSDDLIGGIGVSGGNETQDEQCAKAGIDVIGDL
ncbi:hypothetical protein OI25_2997 [Paraburkholderia fungorum]|uniref:Heme-binding protein n=1 Tax=Paraburkholderia fungorum TaxID=134537 RepID=A0AAU8T0U9_9BURK|nr:heme-binding protein [Paraburkholderia fungorum]AJZ59807.1 hypothetical protein OI25_2997 [Paraburkholderia fungorum]